ncbi:hypothetical protein CLAFUW4_00511 [Fulvia fulva]|uniref:Protein phosphatase n=1 Tax=Passalora fulva TaxID=5499 RepID=A0A9Q8P4G9_PASFU|nr:uncharacterized protein CLAFUR5_00511 [Fulvia fulva]KAK4634930.1 hypothetical protein CLAFUR4_00512 [Fulvia fulva]KAK4636465.1 hypothetical protein CLAFUR0_00513 [Fulvia fulva]UJO12854.1 hypothetical protein CLAFUR5_00511 [Fulvia fulva]WPV09543.1 hypothetical protein CLAFUW4_00511 [Fulvia fulva]WPV23752.1 hypothetical protein CLAFUW7_00516 [Fulvia fulva]
MLVNRGTSSLTSTASRLSTPSMPARHSYSSGTDATSFTYRLAAASAPKRSPPPRQPQHGKDYWNYASTHVNPSPPYLRSTKPESGEDAFFATTIGGSPHHVAFGLADGVGGWQDQGVDPSEYSQALCGLMAGSANIHEGVEEDPVKPQSLLQKAYDAVMSNPRIAAGGCTASLGVADKTGNIETANLGDSGYLIFSPGKVAHRSEVQTHAFNTPYQFSKVPAKMQAQYAIFGGQTHFSETPNEADVDNHQLKHGDIVLFATDGVWDNLSAQDTLQVVARVMEEGGYWSKSSKGAETMLNHSLIQSLPRTIDNKVKDSYLPGQIAAAVMREAKIAGLDRRREGPFAKEVKARYPQEGWEGGKPDDIAVVVCIAVEESSGVDKLIKAKL